jgi:probable rRNA maturation factor
VLDRQAKSVRTGLVQVAAELALRLVPEGLQALPSNAAVHVVLVDEAEIARLNRAYLGRDEPTDVIAFPMQEMDDDAANLLGEVAVCVDVVARQAREQGHSLDAELAEVVAHGVLHVLGYDDGTAAQRAVMDGLQRAVLTTLRDRGDLAA